MINHDNSIKKPIVPESPDDFVEFEKGDDIEFDRRVKRVDSRTYMLIPKGNKQEVTVVLDENGEITKILSWENMDMTGAVKGLQRKELEDTANNLRAEDKKMIEYMQSPLYQNLYALGEGENQLPEAKNILTKLWPTMKQYTDIFPEKSIEILPYLKKLAETERIIFDTINQAIIEITS